MGPSPRVDPNRVLVGGSLQGAGGTIRVPLCGGNRATAATRDTFPTAVSLGRGSSLQGLPHTPLSFTCL